MHQTLLLGIDIGTTFCKASAVSVTGVELAHARIPTSWRLVPGGAEADPDTICAAAFAAARRVLAEVDGPVASVGVASMAESGVLLDRAGRAVAPTIAWYDSRGGDEAAILSRELGDQFSAHTGLAIGPMPTVAKLGWLRRQKVGSKRGVRWLNVAEFVVRCLGGDDVAERSLSSRTGFLDQQTGLWWDPALTWAGVRADLFPALVGAGSPAGRVRSAELPRAVGAVLTVAGHDHLSAAAGAGALRLGDVLNSCGTAEAVVGAVVSPLATDRVLQAVASGLSVGAHVVPGFQALLGGALCGIALNRFLGLLGVREPERDALDAAALAAPHGAHGLIVRDALAERATLAGIDRDVTAGLVWRAAIEAVQREALRLVTAVQGIAGPTTRLVVVGGWARNGAVRGIKEEILGPLVVPPVEEAGARGAALLGGVAAGIFPGILELPEALVAAPVSASLRQEGGTSS